MFLLKLILLALVLCVLDETDLQLAFVSSKDRAISEKQPSRQTATPEDIGEIVCFLCSPASNQITGSTITVDGGWTAQ